MHAIRASAATSVIATPAPIPAMCQIRMMWLLHDPALGSRPQLSARSGMTPVIQVRTIP